MTGADKVSADEYSAVIEVYILPLESEDFTASCAGTNEEVCHGLPEDRFVLNSGDDICHLFGGVVIGFFFDLLR